MMYLYRDVTCCFHLWLKEFISIRFRRKIMSFPKSENLHLSWVASEKDTRLRLCICQDNLNSNKATAECREDMHTCLLQLIDSCSFFSHWLESMKSTNNNGNKLMTRTHTDFIVLPDTSFIRINTICMNKFW